MSAVRLRLVFWSFAVLLLVSGLGSAGAMAVLGYPMSMETIPDDSVALLSLLVSSAVGLVAALALGIRRVGWACVRLTPMPERMLAIAMTLVPVSLALSFVWTVFLEAWGGPVEPQLFVQGVLKTDDTAVFGVAVLYAVVGAPILEEALFRGFMLPVMIEHLGRWPGILLNAALFGVIHAADPWAVIPVMGVGVMAAWLRDKSGGLGAGILFHATNNLCALLLVTAGYRFS